MDDLYDIRMPLIEEQLNFVYHYTKGARVGSPASDYKNNQS